MAWQVLDPLEQINERHHHHHGDATQPRAAPSATHVVDGQISTSRVTKPRHRELAIGTVNGRDTGMIGYFAWHRELPHSGLTALMVLAVALASASA
jgi:hypothetical protein